MRQIIYSILILLLFPGIIYGQSCTHYVSADGAASWAEATNISTPTSIATAMSNADDDNVVCFRSGTYSGSSSVLVYNAVFHPTNSGSSGHPITFKNYPGETPIISITCTFEGNKSLSPPQDCYLCWGIGSSYHDYITWDGFTLVSANGSTTGFVAFGTSASDLDVGNTFKNIIIDGGDNTCNSRENCDIIRIENQSGALLENIKAEGFLNVGSGGGSDNTAILKLYHDDAIVVKNCEFYRHSGVASAISLKGWVTNSSFYNNFIHDINCGFRINTYDGSDSHDNLYYNNIIYHTYSTSDVSFGVLHYGESLTVGYDHYWYNNTIYTPNYLPFSAQRVYELKVYNNIFYSSASRNNFETRYSYATISELDHNNFYRSGGMSVYKNYGGTGATQYTSLATLHASGWEIGGSNPHDNINVDPTFVNASGTYSLPSDFQPTGAGLSTGSRTGGYVGADWTTVGFQPSTVGVGTISNITIGPGVSVR